MMFNGMRVITSVNLVIDGEPIEVKRRWRERWLSRPWRPWRRTKIVVPKIPNPRVFQIGPDTLVMHPVTWARLQGMLPPLER